MIRWLKQLFCIHYYAHDWPWNQQGARVGLVSWRCAKCNKKINKDIDWEPLNDIIHR